uniref:ARID domain-containing protein n=1 Tax=Eptatretus burgeri TaxID=7764 RepID=A0A8C4NCW1_EPTBU
MQEVEYPAPVGGDLCGGESNWTSLTWQSARDVIDQCGRKREGTGDNRAYEQEAFLQDLHSFMRARKTPIERIPHLGFKQVDLWLLFTTVNRIGGYEQVTARRLWKHVYDVLGGNPGSTSAATCTRRHYER